MDHLERHRTRMGANIRVNEEQIFFPPFLSFGAIHQEKTVTMTQREPQISQTGEERRSKKR